MPRWPGPLMVIVGGLLALGGIGMTSLASGSTIDVGDARTMLIVIVVGAVLFVAGLLYVAIRQLRVRRVLPPDRYRGPSVIILLVLATVIATVVSIPFAADFEAFLTGGDLSTLSAVVLLASTQLAMLLVGWLFVFRTNALDALPSFPGRDAARAVLSGIGWALLAWVGANIVAVAAAYLFELVGVDATPQAAEQAAYGLNPWLILVAFVVLAPIAEEIFFRGIVFNAWLREGGVRFAYIGSAALFALSHLDPIQFAPLFLLGLALAAIYRRTGSLLSAMTMHATFNGITVAIVFLDRFGIINLPS